MGTKCPSWSEIYESQVLTVLLPSGEQHREILSSLVDHFPDLWSRDDGRRLAAALQRMKRKGLVVWGGGFAGWTPVQKKET